MTFPGIKLLKKVKVAGNRIPVPFARGLGLTDLIIQVSTLAEATYVASFAAALAYKGLFATFLFSLFLLSLLGVFRATQMVYELFNRAAMVMPTSVSELLRDQMQGLSNPEGSEVFTIGAVASVLFALWGVSGAFMTLIEAMNIIYGVRVDQWRPLWKRYVLSLLLSLAVAALLISAALLVTFGSPIGEAIAGTVGLGAGFRWTWRIVQWPLLIFFVLLAFCLVYYYAPNVPQRLRRIIPGAVIGLVLWLLFTLLLLLFVNVLGENNRVYGAAAAVAIHMLYMYYVSYILLIGAVINRVVEAHVAGTNRGRGEATTLPAETAMEGG